MFFTVKDAPCRLAILIDDAGVNPLVPEQLQTHLRPTELDSQVQRRVAVHVGSVNNLLGLDVPEQALERVRLVVHDGEVQGIHTLAVQHPLGNASGLLQDLHDGLC